MGKNGKVMSFINQKGGVGKTSLCVWTAAWLEKMYSAKVLVIDADYQADSTKYLHGEASNFYAYAPDYEGKTIYDVLTGGISISDAIQTKAIIDYNNGKKDRVGELSYLFGSQYCDFSYLNMSVADCNVAIERIVNYAREKYDYILFDCHPAKTPLELSILEYTDLCVIPTLPEIVEVTGAINNMIAVVSQTPSITDKRQSIIVVNRCENKSIHNSIISQLDGLRADLESGAMTSDSSIHIAKSAVKGSTYASICLDQDILLPYFKQPKMLKNKLTTFSTSKDVVEEFVEILNSVE